MEIMNQWIFVATNNVQNYFARENDSLGNIKLCQIISNKHVLSFDHQLLYKCLTKCTVFVIVIVEVAKTFPNRLESPN